MMVKTIISLIITIFLFTSFVNAGPFYNFTIQVDNLDNIAVENADVHFYADSDYDFSGITDENGEFMFEIDARLYLPIDNTQEMIFTNTNNPNQPNVQNKKVNQNRNGRLTRDFLIPQKTFILDITSETSEYTFQDYTAQAVVTIDEDKTFEVEVNFDPEFEDDSIEVDVYEETISTINLEDYLIPITNDNDYTINLIDAPNWISINGDEITFNLLNNAQDLSFEAEIIDEDSEESDTIDIDVSVYNYDPEFNENSIDITVEEDVLSDYDLTSIIETNTILIDNYVLELDGNPAWVSLNNDELEFNLIDNDNDLSFNVNIRDANDPYEITDTLEINIDVVNHDAEFTENEITISVTEDTFSNYDLNSIINSEIDNYELTIQNNPAWVVLNDDELNFDLQVNNPNNVETFQVLLSETTGEPNTQTLDVTLSITNVNDAPTIGNIPNFVIDETDGNFKSFNLNSIINDEESNLNDLTIELDSSFSEIDADFTYDYPNIEANYIPELNLDYHTNNNLVFTITVTDGENQITSNAVTWGYDPFLKALKGNIINHYTTNDVIGNAITTPNTYPGTNTIISNSEFIGFYQDEYAQVNIENSLYYESNRYIQLDNDLEKNFTIIPIQINASSGYDNIEAGFNQAFRTIGLQGGEYFQGTTKYTSDDLIIFICTNNAWGYTPNVADIAKINTSLTYYDSFTNGLLRPYDNVDIMISDDLEECTIAMAGPGYITINWDPDIGGSGSNGRTLNGHTIIDSRVTILNGGPGPAVYNQELTQAIGPGLDQSNVSPSTFCQGCPVPSIPTNLDHLWMQRNYDRTTGNTENDIDYNPEARNNEFTEVVRIQEKFLPNGEKIKTIERLGYYYANEMFKSYDQVFKKLPKNAKLIKTIDYSQYVQISKKVNNKENKKLKKLI